MAGRGLLETALSNYLFATGWDMPTQRAQMAALPGITPVIPKKGGKGRQPPVYDVARYETIRGLEMAYLVGLKASKTRKTTISVTTGNPVHSEAVFAAADRGNSIPQVVVQMDATIQGEGEAATIIDHGPIWVAVVNVGTAIQNCGGSANVPKRVKGQGKGRRTATFTPAAVSWGEKLQPSKAGKVYTYIELQANVRSCGVEYRKVESLEALAILVHNAAEGIPL